MRPKSLPLLLICFDVNVIKFATPARKVETQAMPNQTVEIDDQIKIRMIELDEGEGGLKKPST